MREIPVSGCESDFVIKCIKDKTRTDNRDLFTCRKVTLSFKSDHGCCIASIGNTKIMAQVTAEMDRPKESRSNEGNLGIFVEMSTMGSPGFDPTKPGDSGAELQRMLERSILLSKSVDLEELCVRVGEQAWNLRLYVQVLSHDGNLLDCATIASQAALAHFKRPDVTISGKNVSVHTFEEKHPVPLVINHRPFFVTFAFFNSGDSCVLDPSRLEEACADGRLMISMNKHREICCTQMSGKVQVSKEEVVKCMNIATKRVKELSELVEKSILNDEDVKKKGGKSSSMSSTSRKQRGEELKMHSTTTNSTMKVPQSSPASLQMENLAVEEDSNKLCWVMEHGENTVTTGEDRMEQESDKNSRLDDNDGSDEETSIVLQLK